MAGVILPRWKPVTFVFVFLILIRTTKYIHKGKFKSKWNAEKQKLQVNLVALTFYQNYSAFSAKIRSFLVVDPV